MLNRGRFNQFVFNGRVSSVVAKVVALAGSLIVNTSTAADVNIHKPIATDISVAVISAPSLQKQAILSAPILASASTDDAQLILGIPLDGQSNAGGIEAVGTLAGDAHVAVSLDSSISTSAAGSGGIDLEIPLNGSSAPTAVVAGGIHVDIPVESSVAVTASVESDVHITAILDGESSLGGMQAAGTLVGDIAIDVPLAAQAQAQSQTTGNVKLEIPIDGAVNVSASAEAAIDQTTKLGTDIGIAVSITGEPLVINVVRSSVDVSAITDPVEIDQTTPLGGDSLSTSAAEGGIDLHIEIAGQAASQVTSTPELGLIVNLDGESSLGGLQAAGTLAGDIAIDVPLATQVQAESTASGGVDLDIPLDGTALPQGQVAGGVHLDIPLDGNSSLGGIQATGTLAADVEITVNLESTTNVTALASGDIELEIPVAGDVFASSVVAGDIHLDIPIDGTASVSADTAADVHITVNLDGQSSLGGLQSVATLEGDVDLTKPLGVAVLGPVTATADIHLTKNSAAAVATDATAEANVRLVIPVASDTTTTEATVEVEPTLLVIHYYDDVVAAVEVEGVSASQEVEENSGSIAAADLYVANAIADQVVASVVVSGVQASFAVESGVTAEAEVEVIETYEISYLMAA